MSDLNNTSSLSGKKTFKGKKLKNVLDKAEESKNNLLNQSLQADSGLPARYSSLVQSHPPDKGFVN